MTVLTDKREAFPRAVGIGNLPAHRAGFARIVRVYLYRYTAMQKGFIGDHALQFSEGPLRVDGIGTALLLARPSAALAPGALADVGQVFQPDEGLGVTMRLETT